MIDLSSYSKEIDAIINKALEEDVGRGDITTQAIFNERTEAEAFIISRCEGILAGLPIVSRLFEKIDDRLTLKMSFSDGTRIGKDEEVVSFSGDIRSIVTGERTALNFLGRLSGIATLTGKFCSKIEGYNTKILDTRKTTPGLRILEKYAVWCGGGINHRLGLYDMILIKENHIKGAGNITKAVELSKEYCRKKKINSEIEVEVKNLEELREALNAGVSRIMLDNMSVNMMKKAVSLAKGKAIVEASGNVNLENAGTVAATGVDYISTGYITHSAPVMDFSLLIK